MKKISTLAAGAALSILMFSGGEKVSASSEETINLSQVESFKEQAPRIT